MSRYWLLVTRVNDFSLECTFYFGGTSLLIIVVVVMDFMAQVHAHIMSYQYESLLKKRTLCEPLV